MRIDKSIPAGQDAPAGYVTPVLAHPIDKDLCLRRQCALLGIIVSGGDPALYLRTQDPVCMAHGKQRTRRYG
ncbi:MAG TPA: hypothetical protein VGF67_05440 [Ktedonobacteraceae bacterium]|jgi:hypothetical protein